MDSEFEKIQKIIVRNPKMADSLHLELIKTLTREISDFKPFYTRLIIQDIPSKFSYWDINLDKLNVYEKVEILKAYIECLEVVLKSQGLYNYEINYTLISNKLTHYKNELTPFQFPNEEVKNKEMLEIIEPLDHNEILNIENKFDAIEITHVYEHFKKGLVKSKYLTEDQLIEYLKVAFEKKKVPKKLFQFKDVSTKQKVIKVFYMYYKNVANKPHGMQKDYASLLGDYFEGYSTKNVITNFSK